MANPIRTRDRQPIDFEDGIKIKGVPIETLIGSGGSGTGSYTHPASHPASMITQDSSHRFVSDEEKAIWNSSGTNTGENGKSAYELAVINGYSGTQAQWLISLKGTNGAAGPQGIQGIAGSSGGSAALGGVSLGEIVLDNSTVNSRVWFAETNPNGWNTAAGRMTASFDFISNNCFTINPDAHLAVVLRSTSTLINLAVRGTGIVMGNLTGIPQSQASNVNPTSMIETWMNSYAGESFPDAKQGNYLWPLSETARNNPLKDNKVYRVIIDSTKTNSGDRFIRYRIWSKQIAIGASPDQVQDYWKPETDTGDVLDHNKWADLTQYGFGIGFVFGSGNGGWSLVFSNTKITWGPAESDVPDQTIKLSRHGGEIDGNFTFLNTVPFKHKSGATETLTLTFNSEGIKIKNASLSIGTKSTKWSGLDAYTNSSFGGPNAIEFGNTANFNLDQLCSVGIISQFINTYGNTTSTMEDIIRPLYCLISVLYKELKDRNVL